MQEAIQNIIVEENDYVLQYALYCLNGAVDSINEMITEWVGKWFT